MTLHLEIAGIHFEASSPPGSRLVVDDPRYEAFVGPSPPGRAERVELQVSVLLDPPPDVSGLETAFESGGTWRAFRDGEDLLFESRLPTPPGERYWTTRLAADRREVTIYCGPLMRSGREGDLRSPLSYPLDQILLMCVLPLHRGVLVHSAGVRRGERAVVFPGRSGAGKSTLSRLLVGAPQLVRMSDDRMVLRHVAEGVRAWGTPWAGTERVAANESAPLAAIAFLHQSDSSFLRRIEPREALEQLLAVASVPWFDQDLTARSLSFCDQVLRETPLYELHFRRDEEVRAVVEELFSEP